MQSALQAAKSLNDQLVVKAPIGLAADLQAGVFDESDHGGWQKGRINVRRTIGCREAKRLAWRLDRGWIYRADR
jgi:hypothetical protein